MGQPNLSEDTIPLTEGKRSLGDLCQRAVESGRAVVLTRHGRGLVAVVPLQEYVALTEYQKEMELAAALQEARSDRAR